MFVLVKLASVFKLHKTTKNNRLRFQNNKPINLNLVVEGKRVEKILNREGGLYGTQISKKLKELKSKKA